MHGSVLTLAMIWTATGWFAGDARLIDENRRTAQRFVEAAALESRQSWDAALNLYMQIIDENGSDLVVADSQGDHLVTARSLAQRRIAGRTELVGPYRKRVEKPAQELLERGVRLRDSRPLEELVRSYFSSSCTGRALDMLGDLACERGDFAAARRYWFSLVHSEAVGPAAALPGAKMILASLLAGDRKSATMELAEFRRQHPNASGRLAGRDGVYTETLEKLAAETASAPRNGGAIEPLFGRRVDATCSPSCFEVHCPPIPLARQTVGGIDRRGLVRAVQLTHASIVVRGQLFVADSSGVSVFDLSNGLLVQRVELLPVSPPRLAVAQTGTFEQSPSLTADDERLYVRLGSPGRIFALQLAAERNFNPRLCWRLPAAEAEFASRGSFSGSPVVHGGMLFVGTTRQDGNRQIAGVECYDPDDAAPSMLWKRDVSEVSLDLATRSGTLLLTPADHHVVFGPCAGVVALLDSGTGQCIWAARYESTATQPPRRQSSCVVAGDRLFAAPAERASIIAMEVATGARLWECDDIAVSQLLGVAEGKLLFQFNGATAGLGALDVRTGRRIPDWGYSVFGNDAAAPFGRGVLFADTLLWPTRSAGVKSARIDGSPILQNSAMHELPGGDLTFGDGFLAVAAVDRIHLLRGVRTPSNRPETNPGADKGLPK